jgi:hypothetical protein
MLFEAGPLRLVPDAELPRPSVVPIFEGLAGSEVATLEGAAVGLSVSQGTMASAPAPIDPLRTGADVAAAASELARQTTEGPGAIVGVHGNAGAQESELGGLAGEIGRDLQERVPAPPTIPPEQVQQDRNDPQFFAIVTEWYVKYLGRTPSQDELIAHFGNPGGLAGVLAVILNSDEYRERHGVPGGPPPGPPATPTPTPPPPPPGNPWPDGTKDLIDAYMDERPDQRGRIEQFLRNNPNDYGRLPRALELPGWLDFWIRHR